MIRTHMKHPPTSPRQSRGFTLMELIVTLTVLGVLSAMAAPPFTRMVVSSRLAEQTNELIGVVAFSRSEAIRRNATLTLCRVAALNGTTCANSAGQWEFWVLRNAAGAAIRNGVVNTYGNTVRITSTLTNDTLNFGSDGLARTGGNLVNASGTDNHSLRVCSTRGASENIRRVILNAGSRATTVKETATC
jgi:type IV fimbrial biogenesis protein FimT